MLRVVTARRRFRWSRLPTGAGPRVRTGLLRLSSDRRRQRRLDGCRLDVPRRHGRRLLGCCSAPPAARRPLPPLVSFVRFSPLARGRRCHVSPVGTGRAMILGRLVACRCHRPRARPRGIAGAGGSMRRFRPPAHRRGARLACRSRRFDPAASKSRRDTRPHRAPRRQTLPLQAAMLRAVEDFAGGLLSAAAPRRAWLRQMRRRNVRHEIGLSRTAPDVVGALVPRPANWPNRSRWGQGRGQLGLAGCRLRIAWRHATRRRRDQRARRVSCRRCRPCWPAVLPDPAAASPRSSAGKLGIDAGQVRHEPPLFHDLHLRAVHRRGACRASRPPAPARGCRCRIASLTSPPKSPSCSGET